MLHAPLQASRSNEFSMLDIYVDGDACPVKAEIYRVAQRYDLAVFVVANTWLHVPNGGRVEAVLVSDGPDAADDWIAKHAGEGDIVISSDVPLAARCLQSCAVVLGPNGRPFTDDSIGAALASRDLLSHLRGLGTVTGGPPPFANRDRSRFLQKLDETIHAVRRRRK